MKNGKFFLLISIFLFIYCDNRNRITPIFDIDVLQISYELAYEENYALKVIIQTINDLDVSVSFPAKLKAFKSKEEFNLNCHNVSSTEIECYTDKGVIFDLKEKYYFYYTRGENGKYTLEEKDNYEDFKQVNLLFKPEMYTDLMMYRDHRKVIGLNNRKIVGGGYLYLVRNNKKLLHKPKDGFNKIIEMNHFIIHGGITDKIPPCTMASYKEAIIRGYRMVGANIQFTKDKIPIICNQDSLENISGQKGKLNTITLKDLKKIDLGIKYDKKKALELIIKLINLSFFKDYNPFYLKLLDPEYIILEEENSSNEIKFEIIKNILDLINNYKKGKRENLKNIFLFLNLYLK